MGPPTIGGTGAGHASWTRGPGRTGFPAWRSPRIEGGPQGPTSDPIVPCRCTISPAGRSDPSAQRTQRRPGCTVAAGRPHQSPDTRSGKPMRPADKRHSKGNVPSTFDPTAPPASVGKCSEQSDSAHQAVRRGNRCVPNPQKRTEKV